MAASLQAQAAVHFVVRVTPEVTLHEPVVLEYEVDNQSDTAVRMDAGWDRVGAFEIDVLRPDGTHQVAHPHSPPVVTDGPASRGPAFQVPPHGRYMQRAVLDEWVDFSEEGRYTLVIRYTGVMLPVPDPSEGQRLQEIRVVVRPRDASRLREKCEEWLPMVMGVGGASFDASNLLVNVHDPVAVPYIERALAGGWGCWPRFDMFDTLVRIGGPEARQALETLAKSPTPQTAWLAQHALARMK
jgi:hypothetical protein